MYGNMSIAGHDHLSFGFSNEVKTVSFSPDGQYLLSVTGSIGEHTKDTLTLWLVGGVLLTPIITPAINLTPMPIDISTP